MSNLASVLQRLKRRQIAMFGDPMLDCYTSGYVDRVSPEAPVPVLRVEGREWRLGGAASVAGLLRGLESSVSLAGVVGDDSPGQTLRKLLVESGIAARGLLVDANRVTTTKERFLGRTAGRAGAGGQQILRVDQEQCAPISEAIERLLAKSMHTCLDECSALLISDYNKGACTSGLLAALIESAHARRLPIVVDPARIADYSRHKNVSVLIPNRSEAEAATGIAISGPPSALAAAEKLCRACAAEAVIVKLDSEGMVLFEAGGRSRHFGTQAREVYDVTGAGDMVLAAIGACLADGVPLADAVELANVAAGLQVERLGVQPITRRELSHALALSVPTAGGASLPPLARGGWWGARSLPVSPSATQSPKLVTRAEAATLADECRGAGKTLVFTNGCFDLLHVGHVAYLEEAARLGDVLCVAVNSDAGVRRLKGADRPVIDERSRAAMLAALACVDHVVIFDEPTPDGLLRTMRPDVLVKGGTYRLDQVVGREIVEAYGGTVRVLGEVAGISTTQILESVRDAKQVHLERSPCRH